MKRLLLTMVALTPFFVTACDTSPAPPGDTGVCYHYAQAKGAKAHFNVLARGVPNLEQCAADLESMRMHFLGLGGNQTEITGAYQSQFLFLRREGIFTSNSLNGGQFPALVRTSDGHLVPPGSVQQ